MENEKALIVFSGGQDSTTCLFWAKERFADVIALSFDYGQKHVLELDCAKAICKKYGVEHHTMNLGLLGEITSNSLTRLDMDVDKEVEEGSLPNSFVDGRNMLFFTFAAIFAKQKGIKHIVTGVSQSDYSGYPDCRDIFVKSLNVTANLAMEYDFVIHTPLMWLDKAQTWGLADRIGVLDIIKNETLTCYNGIIGDGCGECPACNLRRNGYEKYVESKA
ncbi:7-cyano-7-deazaguanine synthase QueC [Peptoclostridium acidaminophilum DSM 3953]|uniref:7-cyano-7-deazaguanine synthase n=1 Tax=Peptoclostridium acidaminophilum DSM 3953 TaxID=1286171 RepID=W8TIE6_PEPAC|nr:7-cyano-7-deazaguanine synthase QueC [Peptoclostridium acidaminophilum]AHM55982.1 7-cyano-7-deazaguanine synthase QueC [Peptoclostridium acidaminophilum DSM 3953]